MVNEDQQIINLNLHNFESKEALRYPYILTSPRSLKSCRLANVKPIELLQRSIQDISIDLDIPLESVNEIYIDYEKERSRKLEMCKLIRKHMLTMDTQNQEVDHIKSHEQCYNESRPFEKSFHSRGNTPEFLEYFKQIRFSSPVSTSSFRHQYATAGSPTKKQKTKFTLERKSANSKVSSPLPSRQILRSPTHRRTKSAENSKYGKLAAGECIKKSPLMPIMRGELKYEKSRSISCLEKRSKDRQLGQKIGHMQKYDSSTDGAGNDRKPSKTHFEKHFEKYTSPLLRDSQKKLKTRVMLQRKCSKEKNRLEKDNSSRTLENKDRRKHKKNHHNLINQKKMKKITENVRNSLDPLDIKNHDIRILDAMFFNREKEQLERNFVRKADLIWDTCGCRNSFIDRNMSNSLKIKKYMPYGEKLDICTCNENRMFNSYFQQIRNKMKQLKEDSLNQELHREQVRQLARELQTGMEQWQDQVLLLQWRTLQRAKINAELHLENKRLKTQTENNERAQLHTLRFRNVQEIERIKQLIVEKEVEEKNSRIEKLKIKREQEIMDCKAQAQYTADLRDQLRRTLTPETFDRKVNDAMVKSKFITRTLMSSPIIESHIRLG